MGDLLEVGAAWLHAQRTRHLATTVQYARGSWCVELPATLDRTAMEVDDSSGAWQRHESRDFLLRLADCVVDGVPFVPQRGDRIVHTHGGRRHTFEVMAPGDAAPWRYSDPFHTGYRVHTKHIRTEDI